MDKKMQSQYSPTIGRKANALSISLRIFNVLAVLLLTSTVCNGFEIDVHEKITEEAVSKAPSYIRFINNLQFDMHQTLITIRDGSATEDNFPRPINHFYDPTNGQGLSVTGVPVGKPSLQWGFSDTTPIIGNDYSWTKAREYMYTALTGRNFSGEAVALTADLRKPYSQNMFRSVGQVMHLVEDLASPAHVRNDSHLAGDIYERLTSGDNFKTNWLAGYSTVKLNQFADPWNLGLATFTNNNFVSQYTNFSDFSTLNGPYTSPHIDHSMRVWEDIVTWSGTTVTVQVDYQGNTYQDTHQDLTGQTITETITNDRLATYSVFDFRLQELLAKPVFSLNTSTVKSAANILVRRAVGYAAGLLEFFFRGDLRVIYPSGGGIQFQNVNTETMSYFDEPSTGNRIGRISVFYDNTSGRQLLTSYDLTQPLTPGQLTPVISFNPPTDNIKPGKYIVVFRGKLGEEEGAIIVASSMKIYYVSNRQDPVDHIYRDKIYRMEMDGSNPTLVYDNQDQNVYLGFLAPSPDGHRLAFEAGSINPGVYTIYMLNMLPGAVNPLTTLTTGEQPSWSPDGTIVFQRQMGFGDHEIFQIDPESRVETQITRYDPNNDQNVYNGIDNNGPVWSPDGSKIAIYKSRVAYDPQTQNCPNVEIIYLISPTGNVIEPVSCADFSFSFTYDKVPSWSRKGNEIVFQRRSNQRNFYEMYKVDVATKAQTKLTDSNGTSFNELNPVWSPDGRVIAVGSDKDGDFDIWLVDANGGGYLANLTHSSNPGIDGFPAFGLAP